jgi:hypothetical protein
MSRARAGLAGAFVVVLGAIAVLGWSGCTNDVFKPETVANQPPSVRFFIAPGDSNGELNPTSYNHRTFSWSGSDQDGTVVAYYVSVRPQRDVAAPWIETTNTDTTMTFTTDDLGHAEATFYLVCRDNLGALSDTVVQYVPLRNFPPAINFQSDFEPYTNLQREIVYDDGGAPQDTVYWNWGAMSARLFALDPDGGETMGNTYRYTVADPLPDCVRPVEDPAADPEVCWVEVPFGTTADIRDFEVVLAGLAPGLRTLTIAVSDEAAAETRFTFSWEVRAPRGRLLLVPDNYGSLVNNLYRPFLNGYLGEDGYDTYDFWYGYPDNPAVLLASLRQFDVVLWLGGGSTSSILSRAAARGGVLEQYLNPEDGSDAGRLMLISRALTGGGSTLPNYFRQTILGIGVTASPPNELVPEASAVGATASSPAAWLPDLTLETRSARGVGLTLQNGTEVLYRFDPCTRCFGNRPPWDPIIAFRRPLRAQSALARVVGFSFDLEYMQRAGALSALDGVLTHELGVTPP